MIAFWKWISGDGRLAAAVLAAAAMAGTSSGDAEAKTSWRGLKPDNSVPTVCLRVADQAFDYYELDSGEPAVLKVRGPRRVRIAARYLFSDQDPDEQVFTLRVLMDGREILRKSIRSRVLAGPAYCGGRQGDIGGLRKSTINVPTGQHEIQVFADAPPGGGAAARFFRESRGQAAKETSLAPEGFDAVYHLQFDSGKQSTYYHFGADSPLRFAVKGPASIKISTRLDFDLTMNGAQNYSLELLHDGKSENVYHYHAEKVSAAHYVERQDLLPGDSKVMRITVPKGLHRYELRCLRPENCGIACQIRIPEADVKP
jgi:hypothetical protein